MPSQRIVVLLIDSDPQSAEGIQNALLQSGAQVQLESAARLSQGLGRLFRGGIDLVLLSLELPDASGPSVLEQVLAAASGVPVIVLGEQEDPEIGLYLVRAGAQDYLVKSRLTAPALVRVVQHSVERYRHIQRLLASARPRPELGKVITFYGVKGGVGATTTVLNAAAALGQTGKRVVAAELLPSWGFTTHLRRTRATGLGELLGLDPEAIDGRELERRLTPTPYGFHVLFGTSSSPSQSIQPEPIKAVIDSASEMADFVLVDLPSHISPLHSSVASASDYIVLVLEPDPLCAEYASTAVTLFEQWGMNPAALGLALVNRAALANSMPPRELKTLLGCDVVGILPAAGEACVLAFKAAKPLFMLQPESRYSSAVSTLAENLAQTPVRALSF